MKANLKNLFFLGIASVICVLGNAQSASDSLQKFCTIRIEGQSPAKIAYASMEQVGDFDVSNFSPNKEYKHTDSFNGAQGLRFGINYPIVNSPRLLLQVGINYAGLNYSAKSAPIANLSQSMDQQGLRTSGLSGLVFKPFNERNFMVVSSSLDQNGNYGINRALSINHPRWSYAVLFGKKVRARKMFAFGMSRTFRGGQVNYIPVILFNWTDKRNRWGTEILLLTRANLRYRFSDKTLLMLGGEIEGNSYRILSSNATPDSHWHRELRRSEFKTRLILEQKISGNLWLSAQAGYRMNNVFNEDILANNVDFFRGFSTAIPFAERHKQSGTWYTMLTLCYATQ